MTDYVDETHQRICEFADEFLGDDEEEHQSFVDGLMERRGYIRQSHWGPPDDPGGGQGSGKPPLLKSRRPAAGQRQGGQGQRSGSYFRK